MRLFLLQPVFWRSAAYAALRSLGLSSKTAYRVMVRVEPVWLKDEQPGKREAFGLFTTRVVMAHSDLDARAAAIGLVRGEVLAIAVNSADSPPAFEVEASDALWVAWRQPGGFSLFPLGQGPAASDEARRATSTHGR